MQIIIRNKISNCKIKYSENTKNYLQVMVSTSKLEKINRYHQRKNTSLKLHHKKFKLK